MARVILTEAEAEQTILALEYFRRFHLDEYDAESRAEILSTVRSAEKKLRDAP